MQASNAAQQAPKRTKSLAPAAQLSGQVLGKVRLEKLIGEGSVGAVYRGIHQTLSIPVAVKVLKNRESTRDSNYRERFRNEARIAARLDHPGIVRVIDFGEEGKWAYLVMEYVDGFTLESYLAARGENGIKEMNMLRVLMATCQALSEAHGIGIIHRDLKPGNLLLTKKGNLKIADLGLARIDSEPSMTQDDVLLGSPAYMAPECVNPKAHVDHRADLYAIGVMAYQMTFNCLPYRGSVKQILHGHVAGQARFDLPHGCSEQTIALIRQLMAVEPEHRPADSKAVTDSLRQIIGKLQTGATANAHTTRRVRRPQRYKQAGEGSTAQRRAVGTNASKSTTAVGDLVGMVDFLNDTVSTYEGETIVHSTGRERLIIVALLIAIAVIVISAVIVTQGGKDTAAAETPTETPTDANADGSNNVLPITDTATTQEHIEAATPNLNE